MAPRPQKPETGEVREGSAAAVWTPIEEVMAWEANPKDHTGEHVDRILASIERFGWLEPIVANVPTKMIVSGHGRRLAALKRGDELVPVRWVSLSAEEAELAALAANRLQELSGYDDGKLADVLRRHAERDREGLRVAGFDDSALAKALRNAYGPPADPDEVSALPKDPVSRLGDVWSLGAHMLVVGSCETLHERFSGKAALMVTDPPYGVSYADKNRFLNAVWPANRVEEPIASDHQTPDQISASWRAWFGACRPLLKAGASYYVTGPQVGDLLLLLLQALRESGFPLRHMLIWAKNNLVLGRSDYHYQHEPIIYGWVDGAAHHKVAERGETSLWQIPKPQKSDLHPTMKPVEFYERAIRNSTDPHDVVLEPFAGSGTAFVACERLERVCIGSEIDPHYADVTVQRWEKLTGRKAALDRPS